MEFKVGDEVWWFQSKTNQLTYFDKKKIIPGSIELVHDIITAIELKTPKNGLDDDLLICWCNTHKAGDIWGRTRQEAWDKLKKEIEMWGKLT